MVPDIYQSTTFIRSPIILDIISIKETGFSYYGIHQSISFKLKYDFVHNFYAHGSIGIILILERETLFQEK